jgi:DNA-binding protein
MPPKKSDFSNLWVSQYTNPYILVNVGQKKFQVDKLNEITLRASGKAIPNACLICEQLKRRVKNLH